MKWLSLVCVVLVLGCQQPLPAPPTPIYVGLSGQLRAAMVKKNAGVVALAKSLEAVTDDAAMRDKWNTGFKTLEDAYAEESSTALKAALGSATDQPARTALWKEVQKAYGP